MTHPFPHPIPCVGVIVENSNGEVLLGKRIGTHGANEWGLPGGKMDFGERVIDAAVREVKEETGLDVRYERIIGINDDLEWIADGRQYLTIIVQASMTKGAPTVCEPDKCAEWQWYHYNNLPKHIFRPSKRGLDLAQKEELYQPNSAATNG